MSDIIGDAPRHSTRQKKLTQKARESDDIPALFTMARCHPKNLHQRPSKDKLAPEVFVIYHWQFPRPRNFVELSNSRRE
jgi:hypothetical protein